ncbi:uncharacterized protein LOC117083112 [Trachypithecus francoisi]|uniref:uncharacterized protein LOC117083112 n=1 Tax=Trachypithecus francoisi TaxID=54180 RepID=UPI00141AD3E5|nr:uncharacterized protein LOC117083112 [Trachypithecus francoisi]
MFKVYFSPIHGLAPQSGFCSPSLPLQLSHYSPSQLDCPYLPRFSEKFPSIFCSASAFASFYYPPRLHLPPNLPPPPPFLSRDGQVRARGTSCAPKFLMLSSEVLPALHPPLQIPSMASSHPSGFLLLRGPASTPLPFPGSSGGLDTDPRLFCTVLQQYLPGLRLLPLGAQLPCWGQAFQTADAAQGPPARLHQAAVSAQACWVLELWPPREKGWGWLVLGAEAGS